MKKTRLRDFLPIAVFSAAVAILLPIIGYIVMLQVRNGSPADAEIFVPSAAPVVTPAATHVPTDSAAPAATVTPVPAADATAEPEWQFDTSPEQFWNDGVLSVESEYRSPDVSIRFQKIYDTETFHKRLTYCVAEIYVRDVTLIRTAHCKDDFARVGHGQVEKMARENNALIAISGDYCGFHGDSLVIRNGVTYRAKMRKGDICLLLRDGTMEMIRGSSADMQAILECDPWQGWQFGPILLTSEGKPRTNFGDNNLSVSNPRCSIGYVEPGHYFFVVVDGRQKYSKGLSLTELAELMASLGCTKAFNLDGGASAHFYWNDQIISNPCGGGRQMSDIIYIAKETYPVSDYYPGKDGNKN